MKRRRAIAFVTGALLAPVCARAQGPGRRRTYSAALFALVMSLPTAGIVTAVVILQWVIFIALAVSGARLFAKRLQDRKIAIRLVAAAVLRCTRHLHGVVLKVPPRTGFGESLNVRLRYEY